MRVLVASPFGLAIRGIHQDRTRMEALGTPVYLRLLVVYVIAGAFAGVAGALAAQTAEAVSLQSLGFVLSAEALIMLVLGGAGRLYGAVVGVVVFKLVQHVASAIDPFQWYFAIGAMLVAVVLFAPKGLLSLLERLWQRLTGSRSAL
jgi:branched-chain amino acid transport system permease protein